MLVVRVLRVLRVCEFLGVLVIARWFDGGDPPTLPGDPEWRRRCVPGFQAWSRYVAPQLVPERVAGTCESA